MLTKYMELITTLTIMANLDQSNTQKKLNNIRLNVSILERLNAYVPLRRRSAFIRDALETYLNLPTQNLMDRPRIRGSKVKYRQVPFLISDSQKAKIDLLYPDVSISVVVQNAITNELNSYKWPPPKEHKRNMLTRVPEPIILKLKKIATKPEYGSLRAMNVDLFKRFINERPYAKEFKWFKATRDRAGANKQFNVLFPENFSDELTKKVKDESIRIEVDLASFLYTALVWWVGLHESDLPND